MYELFRQIGRTCNLSLTRNRIGMVVFIERHQVSCKAFRGLVDQVLQSIGDLHLIKCFYCIAVVIDYCDYLAANPSEMDPQPQSPRTHPLKLAYKFICVLAYTWIFVCLIYPFLFIQLLTIYLAIYSFICYQCYIDDWIRYFLQFHFKLICVTSGLFDA